MVYLNLPKNHHQTPNKWKLIEEFFQQNFTDGERPDLDTILFLIGVQELRTRKKTIQNR